MVVSTSNAHQIVCIFKVKMIEVQMSECLYSVLSEYDIKKQSEVTFGLLINLKENIFVQREAYANRNQTQNVFVYLHFEVTLQFFVAV